MAGNSESVSKGWLNRPRHDPQKCKEYHEIYRRTDKGAAILKEGKRRYWEKLKADPVRLEQHRAKVREAMRLRRFCPDREAQKAERRRYIPKKPMKPLTIESERKKNWVSARRRSLFVENAKTIGRGRPRKKKTERPHCDHDKGFKFKMTALGMRRTCNTCKRSFTEVGRPI